MSVSAESEAEVQLISGHHARWKGLPCLHHKVVGNGRSRQNLLTRQARFRLLRVIDMEPREALHSAFRAPVDRDETKTEEDHCFLERPTTARLSQNSAALFEVRRALDKLKERGIQIWIHNNRQSRNTECPDIEMSMRIAKIEQSSTVNISTSGRGINLIIVSLD